jgi:hypothetical protein
VLEAVADVEGHHGVAVGRDDLRAGTDEVQVCLHHGLGGFSQCQGRPFGLTERRTTSSQFAAHAAVEDDDVFLVHGKAVR